MRPLSRDLLLRDLLLRDPDTRTRWWCDECCAEFEREHEYECPYREPQP